MNPSPASSADRRGNPWYEVFAARIRTANVKICTTQYIHPAALPAGKTARAICDTTESVELGRACVPTARYETPTKIVIATTPSTPRVRAAFFDCGRRNALTPFAIASTPVRALAPDANALRTRKMVTAATPAGIGWGDTARGHALTAPFVTPAPPAISMA